MTCSDERNGRWASIYAHQVNKGYSAFLMGRAKNENTEVEPEKIEAWEYGWLQAESFKISEEGALPGQRGR